MASQFQKDSPVFSVLEKYFKPNTLLKSESIPFDNYLKIASDVPNFDSIDCSQDSFTSSSFSVSTDVKNSDDFSNEHLSNLPKINERVHSKDVSSIENEIPSSSEATAPNDENHEAATEEALPTFPYLKKGSGLATFKKRFDDSVDVENVNIGEEYEVAMKEPLPTIPYLRKRSGLARYNMKTFTKFKKNKQLSSTLPQRKLLIESKQQESNLVQPTNEKDYKTDPVAYKKLDPFEQLEELATHDSFSSTSSKVTKLLEANDSSVCSTPINSKAFQGSRLNLNPLFNCQGDINSVDTNTEKNAVNEIITDNEKTSTTMAHSLYSGILKNRVEKMSHEKKSPNTPSPKVHFQEQSVEVLEFIDDSASPNESCLNDSDLVSYSDLMELATLSLNSITNIHDKSEPNEDGRNTINDCEGKIKYPETPSFPKEHLKKRHLVSFNKENVHNECSSVGELATDGDVEAQKLLLLSKVHMLNKEITNFKQTNRTLEKLMKDIEKEKEDLVNKQASLEIMQKFALDKSSKPSNSALQQSKQKAMLMNEVKTLNESLADLEKENKLLKSKIVILEQKEKRLASNFQANKKKLDKENNMLSNKSEISSKNSCIQKKTIGVGTHEEISNHTNKFESSKKCSPLCEKNIPQVETVVELERNSLANSEFITKKTLSNVNNVKRVEFQSPESNPPKVHFEENDKPSEDGVKELYSAKMQPIIDFGSSLDHSLVSVEKEDDYNNVKLNINQSYDTNFGEKSIVDGVTIYNFPNGDKKTIYPDKIIYFYNKDKILQTFFEDGKENRIYSNGQEETYFKDGSYQYLFPDHSSETGYRDGSKIYVSAEGHVTKIDKNGRKTVEFPNGEKEIYYSDQTHRIYPDGSVKILYADGKQETRYKNGKIRIKDKHGNVVHNM